MSEPIAGGRMTALDAAFYNLERMWAFGDEAKSGTA